MGFCCLNCGDQEHQCTAWDGKGVAKPNLMTPCPAKVETCPYRKENVIKHPNIFDGG
jgi:hypothetical protein